MTNKKITKTAEQPAVPNTNQHGVVKTPAQQIWDDIEHLPIMIFGLPDQEVKQHLFPQPVEPSKLYLTFRASAALPALETSLETKSVQGKYAVELADKFIVVSKNPKPLSIKK